MSGSSIPFKIKDNLILLIHMNDFKTAIKFLDSHKNLDINSTVNQMGDTLLHYAAYKNSLEFVAYLLSKGAVTTTKNSRGLTPADLAVDKTIKEKLIKVSY